MVTKHMHLLEINAFVSNISILPNQIANTFKLYVTIKDSIGNRERVFIFSAANEGIVLAEEGSFTTIFKEVAQSNVQHSKNMEQPNKLDEIKNENFCDDSFIESEDELTPPRDTIYHTHKTIQKEVVADASKHGPITLMKTIETTTTSNTTNKKDVVTEINKKRQLSGPKQTNKIIKKCKTSKHNTTQKFVTNSEHEDSSEEEDDEEGDANFIQQQVKEKIIQTKKSVVTKTNQLQTQNKNSFYIALGPENSRAKTDNLDHYLLSRKLFDKESKGYNFEPPEAEISVAELKNEISNLCQVVQLNNGIGQGLFALQDIEIGSYLIYFGEIEPRGKRLSDRIEMAFGDDFVIYCGEYRSKAYFVNHCCEPNSSIHLCEVQDGNTAAIIKIDKLIKQGQEITVNYGWSVSKYIEKVPTMCLCNSSSCRGFIEEDAYHALTEFLKNLKKTEKEYNYKIEEVTKNNILEQITKFANGNIIHVNVFSYLVYLYSVLKIHICGETETKNKECCKCTQKFYDLAHSNESTKGTAYKTVVSPWILTEKSNTLQYYCNIGIKKASILCIYLQHIKEEREQKINIHYKTLRLDSRHCLWEYELLESVNSK